ncbi:MAG: prephenate dehydrogenase [Gammaproteobacteria bacterium]
MFNKVYLVGVGLINASLAKDLKKNKFAQSIVGIGRDPQRLAAAQALNIIDEYQLLQDVDVSDADVIVVGVPVGKIKDTFAILKPSLNAKTFLTDVGSSKSDVVQAALEVFGELPVNFIPGHPIAGSEQSGFEHSIEQLYKDRKVILTPTEKTTVSASDAITKMWQGIGADVDLMSASQHDAILSATSHLPHMVAYNLVNYLAKREDAQSIFNYAAGGFYDFTRIASSDPTMWADICVANRDEIIKSIEGFIGSLEELKQKIVAQDKIAIYTSFDQAKQLRDKNIELAKRK